MNPITQHLVELRRSYHGYAWHGPALREALADVSAVEASLRPFEAHNIWEITLHVTAGIEEVTQRLGGEAPSLPERGDWPAIAETTEGSWAEMLSALESAQYALEEAVEAFPPERLANPVGGSARDAPLGTGISFSVMLHGLAQHNAYHAGQIALLKGAVRLAQALYPRSTIQGDQMFHTPLHKEAESAVRRWWSAWEDKDLATILALASPDYHEFTGHSDQHRVGRGVLEEVASRAFKVFTTRYWELAQLRVRLIEEVAVVTYCWRMETERAGQLEMLDGVATDVLVWRGDRWSYYVHHSSPLNRPAGSDHSVSTGVG